MPGLYRLELQVTKGSGKLATSGLWNSSSAKEQVKIAFDYFKANASRISGGSKVLEHDFHLHVVELQNTGPLSHLSGFRFWPLRTIGSKSDGGTG